MQRLSLLPKTSEEDVTKTLYRETLIGNHDNEQTVQVNGVTITTSVLKKPAKVNKICDAVLEELRKNPTAHLQNIITANVCKNPPDYEGGLRVVAELQSKHDQKSGVLDTDFLKSKERALQRKQQSTFAFWLTLINSTTTL